MEAVVFIFVLLGLLFITVGALSSKVSTSYLMVFAFGFVFLRSELAYMFEKSPHKESMEMLMNVAIIVCVVIFIGAVTYRLVSSIRDKKKDKKLS